MAESDWPLFDTVLKNLVKFEMDLMEKIFLYFPNMHFTDVKGGNISISRWNMEEKGTFQTLIN